MSSKIKIKRSEVSGNPAVLGQGELAYSGLPDNGANGGDRLYIGMGTETDNNAVNHVVIGGKFFTDMLDHTKGILTAESAIITDIDNKISQLNVDNIRIDGNTISSINTDGHINLVPNGAGTTIVTNLRSSSPEFTGIPLVPTAIAGTNTTQIASTAFVRTEVDNARIGIDAKESVVAATTAPITLNGTQTVDGVPLQVGDRVLVKNQGDPINNGIYIVSAVVWARSTDAVTGSLTPGAYVFVEDGTVNADSGWVLSTTGVITVGTTPLVFSQFSGAGQITAGNGLTKTGAQLDVGAGTGITVNADDVALTGQALAFHNLNTNGIVARTGANTVAARTITGTTNRLTVTNGDGISGNPTLDISTSYSGQSTITTVGTITSGVWNGTGITVPNGGTGLGSVASRSVVYGNGTAALGVTGVSSINGSFLREDSTGNPYWSNQIDGGTY